MISRTGSLIIGSSLHEVRNGLPEVPRHWAAKGRVMQSAWFSRLFFAVVAAMATSAVLSGTACTRWGKPGPVPPTLTPLSSIYVNASSGSDTTGNGSSSKPYKTFTKAMAVVAASKSFARSGVTIFLASGNYDTANGEKFPIVVPTNVTISGANYGMGPPSGTFINGAGEDLIFESIVHARPRSAYATLEVVPPANINVNNVYVGASKLRLPSARAQYWSFDVLGTLNGSDSTFGAGIVSPSRNINGVLVAGGSLNCSSCQIRGNNFGIGALSVPMPSSSPSAPSITLSRAVSDSTIAAKVVDIVTDGSVNVTASNETFELASYAFQDSLAPILTSTIPGAVDFGGGTAGSTGGNVFIGARGTEMAIVRRSETIYALDDTWNPNQQLANRNGQYPRTITFGSGAAGKNVTILRNATGSTVTVGPAPVPTPSSSPTPTSSPT
jgi:Protein of unknown function (DUF1565)